jgi:hypothetical protein
MQTTEGWIVECRDEKNMIREMCITTDHDDAELIALALTWRMPKYMFAVIPFRPPANYWGRDDDPRL